jgi:hypothetical protein
VTTLVIIVVAVFFLGMGVYALAAPAALARPFRFTVDTPESRSEIRAVYGGFGVAIAATLGIAVSDDVLRPGVLGAVAAALAGMAAGRLVSRLVERPAAFYPSWLYFWIEAAAAALLFAVA